MRLVEHPELPIGPPGIEHLDAVVALVGQEIATECRVDRGDVEGGELGPGGRLERSDRLRVGKGGEFGTRRRPRYREVARFPSPPTKAAEAGIGVAEVDGVVGGEEGTAGDCRRKRQGEQRRRKHPCHQAQPRRISSR